MFCKHDFIYLFQIPLDGLVFKNHFNSISCSASGWVQLAPEYHNKLQGLNIKTQILNQRVCIVGFYQPQSLYNAPSLIDNDSR